MKVKQKIAMLMASIMLVNLMPLELKANEQNHVTKLELNDKGVIHVPNSAIPGEIKPSVGIVWEAPTIKDGTGTGNNGKHNPEHYQVQLTNYSELQGGNKPTVKLSKKIDIGETSVQLESIGYGFDWFGNLAEEARQLSNGSFYKAQVYPVHFHEREVVENGEITTVKYPAPPGEGIPASIYFMTDFDTKVEPAGKGLDVSWEYIPGADYELTYVAADKSSKEEIMAEGDIRPQKLRVSASDAKKYLQTQEDKSVRVVYPVVDLVPKQIYSMYVEVIGLSENYSESRFEDIVRNTKTPKVVQGIPSIDIEIYNIGKDRIEILWGSIDWAQISGQLKHVEVWARKEGSSESKYIAQMNATQGSKLESIILDEPDVNTHYKVLFVFKDRDPVWSNEKLYVPHDLRVQPVNPSIPKPYGQNIKITDENKKDYLVSGDTRPFDADFINHTFHAIIKPSTLIQLVWDAPRQPAAKDKIDYDLYYDLWVTDDIDLLSGDSEVKPIEKDLQIMEGMKDNLITEKKNEEKVLGMKFNLAEYIDATGSTKPLKTNNTYYIKIVAKRKYGPEEEKSIPTIVSISIDKNGDIFQPPVIGKPPLRVKKDEVTTTSITLEWLTKWYEILAKNVGAYSGDEQILAEVGSPVVYTPNKTTEPMLRFKPVDDTYTQHFLYKNIHVEQVRTEIDKRFGAGSYTKHYHDRMITLDNAVQYEIEVLEYKEVEDRLDKNQTVENWVAKEANDDKSLSWQSFKPEEGQLDAGGLKWTEYTVDGLKPNTKYMFMLRAYRELDDGEILKQAFPSYVIATTDTDYVGPEPTPTVPDLYLKKGSETDTSFAVYWEYNKDFVYELVYSIGDDPLQAKPVEFTISDDPESPNYVPDGEDAIITLYGLFPETTYNVWIRAKQRVGDKVSSFSTPVAGRTKPIQAPEVPSGLGPAAYQSLLDLGKDMKPIGEKYITVEWNKNPNDQGVQTEGAITKTYEYDLEFADNVEFLEGKVITVKESLETVDPHEILAKSIVKVNSRIANRPYYFKVKARIILKDSETGRIIQKESAYSEWVRIFTKKTDDEYDGGENENIVEYEDAIEEDYDNGIWEWEIVDAQTIISEIVSSNDYYYTIEMDLYRGRDARIRRIKIPVCVVQALIGQRMELRVVTHRGMYEIPAQTIGYMLKGLEATDTVQFDFKTMLGYDMRDFAKPYPYVVEGAEQLTVTTKGKQTGNKDMRQFDGMVKVRMKLQDANGYHYNTFKTYTYNALLGEWVGEKYQIDTNQEATYMSYSTPRVGIYALYKVESYAELSDLNYSMQEIIDRYNIEGLGTQYTQKDKVSGVHYTQILLGIAQEYKDILLTGRLSPQQQKMAQATGLDVGTEYVSQEKAIHGLVKLYEMQTGYRVKPSSKGFSNVSSPYRESVAKAYALGLIDEIQPKEVVTYGQLCDWLINVIQ